MTSPDLPDLFADLPILAEVGAEIDRIAVNATQARRRPSTRARRALARLRRTRPLVLAFVLVAGGTGVALAASGVLVGSPVNPTGPLVATAGEGIPLPGDSRLLALRVPDPAGGLPWGMRIVRTTRSQLCVQIGRVEDGELGELGIDGSFGNDGRFHPLLPADLTRSSAECTAPGATYSDLLSGLYASAAGPPPFGHGGAADRRIISFGLLGPDATSLSYMKDGSNRTLSPLPGLGAYLIVQTDSASVARTDGACTTCSGGSGGTAGDSLPYPQTDPAAPSGAVRSITYNLGGRTCVDNAWSGSASAPSKINEFDNLILRFRRSCGLSEGPPPKGPAIGDIQTPLTAHLQTRGHLITAAEITFRSPVAITRTDQRYFASVRLGSSDFGSQFGNGTDTNRNFARGATVSIPIEPLLASAVSRTVTIEVDYVDFLPGYPNEHATLGAITIHEPAGARPAPLRYPHPLPKIQRRTMLLGLSVPDPAGGPPWGAEILFQQFPTLARVGGVAGSVEFGRVVNHKLGLLGVAGAFSNDRRFHPPDASNLLSGFWGARVSGSLAHPNFATMNHWDNTIPGTVNAEHYCALCTNGQLRTLVAGYVGSGASTVTLTGEGRHQTERLAADDHGIYLFVLKGRWNRRTRLAITARCSDGTVNSGPASSRQGTGKPFCPN
jgi:hypothetical protein